MAIRVALNHVTHYTYDRLINLGPQVIRLRPAPHTRTPLLSYSLKVDPADHFINWQQDAHSNYLARLVFQKPTREFRVEVDLVADLTAINPFNFFLEEYAQSFPFTYESVEREQLAPFMKTVPMTPLLRAYLATLPMANPRTIDFLCDVNAKLQRDIKYETRMDPGVQTPEETLSRASGSCRDSAWLLAQILRYRGLATRFVSGYSVQLVADLPPIGDGPAGPKVDTIDLHAWTEVFLPGAGWVGMDPTSGLFAMEGHIPMACSPEPSTAAAISGPVDICESKLSYQMSVTRLKDDPRSTKPYTEAQWQAILAFGRGVDERLNEDDVRLRIGGEPTFVAIDNCDAPEWNIAAVGPTKRDRAIELLLRLRDRFAPGGLLHYGQGKWYPGESLPRWALSLYWRVDGTPLWRDDKNYARDNVDYGADNASAERFIRALTERLEIPDTFISPVYEDPLEFIVKEGLLPINVSPEDPKLKEPEERARIIRLTRQGLDFVKGYVLPLDRRRYSPPKWVTGAWPVRGAKLYLIPGDSPIGLRLPVKSLPYIPAAKYPHIEPHDPMLSRGPLPVPPRSRLDEKFSALRGAAAAPRIAAAAGSSAADKTAPPPTNPQALEPIARHADGSPVGAEKARKFRIVDDCRTALCIEPREGKLYVFLPPVRELEDYVELVAALEDVAEKLGMPIMLEGYTPPWDSRFQKLMVTPDPGVIEVNTQPVDSWSELVALTEGLYEDARQGRLCAEKYQLDGRPAGSSGGAHITLGGKTPTDSPFLRRPDLLRSMVAYWVNHPALSYVFSGLFIGPTSQAPRVDEARHESVYELEIAFRQIPEGGYIPPWLVDRLFRHLLIDLTGNTHRSEFCIDKLYSPDSVTGRLGIVELRGFEMPPHPRMNLAQQALVRALVSRFWRAPYREPMQHWRHQLHDRFMLPGPLRDDFAAVVRDLNAHGYPIRLDWFEPHFDFRFPMLGSITLDGVTIELRTALEPWNTLGEEAVAGGTARYVDSSVERLQVRVVGLDPARHVLACNGRRVPLTDSSVAGERLGGVRFRAWQPPSCLHPTIGIHSPLIFDLVDVKNGRSIGGCTYHVTHPGGRSHDIRPVNDREAEGRRLARFSPLGHTPGPMLPPPSEPNPIMPWTLDLRWQP